MKLHAKSLGIKLTPRAGINNADTSGATISTTGPLGGNLQALASELHQSATQGIFEYPRHWVLISKVAAVMLIALAAVRIVRTAQPVIAAAQANLPVTASGVSLWELVTAGLGGILAVAVAAILTNLFPTIRITPLGLGVSELIGWRRIPWDKVGVLQVMPLENERYIVMVPFKGATRPPTPAPVLRIIPWLAGAGKGGRGVLFTSEIQNFDRVLQLMVSYMAEAAGQGVPRLEMFIDETVAMPFAQLVLQPEQAVIRMARRKASVDAFGLATDEAEPLLSWGKVLPRQLLIALPPALLVLTAQPTSDHPLWSRLAWAAALLVLGVVELPFMAKLIQTVGDIMVGSGQFARATVSYPELQMPRALLVMLGTVLVTLGLPMPIAEICWLTGLMLTLWLTIRFVQHVYYVSLVQTLLALAGSLIFQVALLALFFATN